MAARTSIPLFPFSFVFFFSISPLTSHCFKITTQLIHRDFHLSPLYNASLTAADRAGRIVESSLARRAYLSAVDDDEPEDSIVGGIEARLVWGTKYNIFYVRFSIGQPPVKQLALLDTGSDLLWLKCPPCSPCPVDSGATFFYSFESKTYSPRPCTTACKKCTESWWPKSPKHCMYTIDYLGGQTSEGVYATDQLVFGTTDGRCTVVPKVLFGCCSKLTGANVLDAQVNGVLGLAGGSYSSLPRGEESIVTRLGSKFSYCVGSLSDVSYPHNRLSFGDAVDLVGDWTPLYLDYGNYYVQMFGISLGGKMLDIKPYVFRKMSIRKKIAMDSGTELFHLYTEAFDVVKAEVQKLASSVLTEVPPVSPLELCYKGTVDKDATGFPALGLHFVGGDQAELVADKFGMFVQMDVDIFCLAALRSESLSIVGIMVQQGYNVGFDLRAMKVYLQNIDCELLQG